MGAKSSKIEEQHINVASEVSFYKDVTSLGSRKVVSGYFNFSLIQSKSKLDEQQIDVASEVSSYKDACKADPSFQSFQSTLHQRTNRVINNLAEDVKGQSLSQDSLKELIDSFVKTDQQVADFILQCKGDMLKNEVLRELVKDYFDNSHQILDLCIALEQCLKRARDSQLMIRGALQQFDEEEEQGQGSDGKRKIYLKTLQELKKFKNAGNPFSQEFCTLLKSVYENQKLMLKKLQAKKSKLAEESKKEKEKKKRSSFVKKAIWVGTVVLFVICSVALVVVMTAPTILTALAAAGAELMTGGIISSVSSAIVTTHLVTIGVATASAASASASAVGLATWIVWIDSLSTKYEKELKAQSDLMNSLEDQTQLAIWELDSIQLSLKKLEGEIESMLKNADLALREGYVKDAIDAIKEELSKFDESIKELSIHTETSRKDTMGARDKILELLRQLK